MNILKVFELLNIPVDFMLIALLQKLIHNKLCVNEISFTSVVYVVIFQLKRWKLLIN